jgi:putative pyrogenic exotoxin B
MKQKNLSRLVALCGVSIALLAGVISCKQETPAPASKQDAPSKEATKSVQLSEQQARMYATMFLKHEDSISRPQNLRSIAVPREISDVNYYVEGRDTLLYAINYGNNGGFVILSGDNSSFPIVAHSDKGHIILSEVPSENPLHGALQAYIDKAKKHINDPSRVNSPYFEKWKDLGKEGYEYEIVTENAAPVAGMRSTREYSSGKPAIYPYTGKELNWSQDGNFNSSAKDGGLIGCPAVAIGMLLFDCEHRLDGRYTHVVPSVHYDAKFATANNTQGRELSKVLRQIADSIPNYGWDIYGSGAEPDDIKKGLHKLGFTKATWQDYNIDTLYKNLSFKAYIYGGVEDTCHRGVLLGAYRNGGRGGHIWFCDGYYEQSYKVTKKFLFIKIKTWKEYEDRIYMNWGWGVDGGNGWYTANDDVWVSEHGRRNPFKALPQIMVGLHSYNIPSRSIR